VCIPIQQLDSKTRRIRVFANIYLVVGIVLIHFAHPSSHLAQMFTDGVGGLLLGLSLVFNLFWIRSARRCRLSQE
jgi:hypothetical protein